MSVFQEKAEVRREEQQKFGIYFDDDYNYLQHLRDVQELNQVEPGEVYRLEQDKPKKVLLNLFITHKIFKKW